MRIIYLVPGVGLPIHEKMRRQVMLNAIAAPGTDIHVHSLTQGPRSIESDKDEDEAIPHLLSFIIANQKACDAFILGCAGDAGLNKARAMASVPIAGPGESSLLLGAPGDIAFAMVTTNAVRAASKFKLVQNAGLNPQRLVASLSVNIPVLEMNANPQKTLNALAQAGHKAKEAQAKVMLLSCMSLAFMEPHLLQQAQQACKLPIINPVLAAVKMAEAMVAVGCTPEQVATQKNCSLSAVSKRT